MHSAMSEAQSRIESALKGVADIVADDGMDLSPVDDAVTRSGQRPQAVLPILQALQEHYGWLPEAALMRVCELTEITPEQITGVATFYHQFRLLPAGRHRVRICRGTACHVKGAPRVHESLAKFLNIPEGGDTDDGGEFTLEPAFCLGCCTLAPVVQVDETTYGGVSYNSAPGVLKSFRGSRDASATPNSKPPQVPGVPVGEVRICLDSCCLARGCDRVNEEILTTLGEFGAAVTVRPVGCVVMCEQTPVVEIAVPGKPVVKYTRVKPGEVRSLLARHFKPRGLARRVRRAFADACDHLANGAPTLSRPVPSSRSQQEEADFFKPQKHIALEHYGELDPLDLAAYRNKDGFGAFERCLDEGTPDAVIETIRQSGLRGRGGAGFPTGRKWAAVRAASGERKYVICNGDEGDPGAFMDRMLMESFPFRVIEGMAIAAHAVGASEGYFYVRAEYPFSVRRLRAAIAICETEGLLGENILGSGVSLKFHLREGAGAFVCGEETALIASLEGERGVPRLKPPFPAEQGLWGMPTCINNVETCAVVPWIIREGPEAFASLGTENSRGTKVFALAGNVRRGGLIEVPMGVTIREIVHEIGGGVPDGGRFKAVQMGGPSGGCVPASLAHTPVDYEALQEVGAIMGSGGMVVLDETDCMVDVARYFLSFTQNESCGQCTFCRVGTLRMLEILERLCAGKGRKADLEELERLAAVTTQGSICGLGRTAPNPVLSTLRHFRDEYEAHIEGRCPAGRCTELIGYYVTDACIGCTLCAQHCPVDAIPPVAYKTHRIDLETCTRCDTCRTVCPVEAIEVR
jgi:NADH-quinone oxidoreductase subunit F